MGSYDIAKSTDFTKQKIPSIRIGTSQRQSIDKSNILNVPGPGNYNLDDVSIKWIKHNSPRPFIGSSKRYDLNRTMNWPGPADYRTNNNFSDIKERY